MIRIVLLQSSLENKNTYREGEGRGKRRKRLLRRGFKRSLMDGTVTKREEFGGPIMGYSHSTF